MEPFWILEGEGVRCQQGGGILTSQGHCVSFVCHVPPVLFSSAGLGPPAGVGVLSSLVHI